MFSGDIEMEYSLKWVRHRRVLFFENSPADIYMFKVKNKNTRARCEICSKLTIKTPERRRRRFGVFIVNFEHISHLALVLLFLTLSWQMPAGE